MHVVERYEWVRGTSVSDTHRCMQTVYVDDVMSHEMAGCWSSMFSESRVCETDLYVHDCMMQSMTAINIDKVQKIVSAESATSLQSCTLYFTRMDSGNWFPTTTNTSMSVITMWKNSQKFVFCSCHCKFPFTIKHPWGKKHNKTYSLMALVLQYFYNKCLLAYLSDFKKKSETSTLS